MKCIRTNYCYAVRNCYTFQCGTIDESTTVYTRYSIIYYYSFYILSNIVFRTFHISITMNYKSSAFGKRPINISSAFSAFGNTGILNCFVLTDNMKSKAVTYFRIIQGIHSNICRSCFLSFLKY